MSIPAQRMNFIVMSPLMAGLRRPASISIHGMTGAAAETQARHAKIATDHSAQQVGEASAAKRRDATKAHAAPRDEWMGPPEMFRPSLGSTPLGPSGTRNCLPDVQNHSRQFCRTCNPLPVLVLPGASASGLDLTIPYPLSPFQSWWARQDRTCSQESMSPLQLFYRPARRQLDPTTK